MARLVVIVINEKQHIPGIDVDVQVLEEFYTAQPRNFVIVGGQLDSDCASKRNLSVNGILGLFAKVDHMYHPATRLHGSEFERVIFHVFAPGNNEHVYVMNNKFEQKNNLLNRLVSQATNVGRQVPVVVCFHSSEPLPPGVALPVGDDVQEICHAPAVPNILGYFTHQDRPAADVVAETRGSWVLQEMIGQLRLYDVKEAFVCVALTAVRQGQSVQVIKDSGFKKLWLGDAGD